MVCNTCTYLYKVGTYVLVNDTIHSYCEFSALCLEHTFLRIFPHSSKTMPIRYCILMSTNNNTQFHSNVKKMK